MKKQVKSYSHEVHGSGGLELVKLARELASRHSAVCIPKDAPVILPVRHSLWTLVGTKQILVRDQFYPQKPPGLRP